MFLILKFLVRTVNLLGLILVVFVLTGWHMTDPARFICYLLMTNLAASMQFAVDAASRPISGSALFVVLSLLELSLPETLLIGCTAAVTQYWCATKHKKTWEQALFRFCTMAFAISAGFTAYAQTSYQAPLIRTAVALLPLFVVDAGLLTLALVAENRGRFTGVFRGYVRALPYFLAASALAGLIHETNSVLGWQTALLVLPMMYLLYRSYHLFVARLESERRLVEETSALNLRTIETLALAVEAKDQTTHDHLQRVQVYAMEIGRELGLDKEQMQALQAASLLHDIGKLAVPEHIISKPGKLTPEEFEKMKIHPVVGAEILERVQFPYPVVPMVRSHHEKWNGQGYPDRLAGEQIPIGARILSAVDCLDALASDRQYRKALPLDQAMAVVKAESGKSFDPQVVEILERRYKELEQLARVKSTPDFKLSLDVKFGEGVAPMAGYAESGTPSFRSSSDAPQNATKGGESIAIAREKMQEVLRDSHILRILTLDELLSVAATRLQPLVPHDTFAVYLKDRDILNPRWVVGMDQHLFRTFRIPLGQGLSGWVAENNAPILNGNPAIESLDLRDPAKQTTLRSALAIPLEGTHGVLGVLALYARQQDAFSKDHSRTLASIGSQLAIALEEANRLESDRNIPRKTVSEMPDARQLLARLESDLDRCRGASLPLTLISCQLDGFPNAVAGFLDVEVEHVLSAIAAKLRESCRDSDYVAHIARDEFVLILPQLRPDATDSKLQQLGESVAAAIAPLGLPSPIRLVSGVVHAPADGYEAEHLLALADRKRQRARLEAKPNGSAAAVAAAAPDVVSVRWRTTIM